MLCRGAFMKFTVRPSLWANLPLLVGLEGLLFVLLWGMGQPPLSAIIHSLLISLAFAGILLQLTTTIEVVDSQLTIRNWNWLTSFKMSVDNLEVTPSAKFDYRHDAEMSLKRRFYSMVLRRFRVGWYVLENDILAFVCLTRRARARAIATKDGRYLLLDPGIARSLEFYLGHRFT